VVNAPWSLRLLGEEPLYWISLEPDSPTKTADWERLERLFPEASVGEWAYPSWMTEYFGNLPTPADQARSLSEGAEQVLKRTALPNDERRRRRAELLKKAAELRKRAAQEATP
jgi:hypothetical protein